ncbi:acid phosphatase, lysosomal-like protein [Sarcoptes scabiei]|uniref:acid phosphatase n=1 Tax=Sarcoptes scabiei TaxID=52283 RepID=A0A132A079_SARSC|nr:acid phosphatase, lysosomal-like protein [Sarcoptes scabiei]
MEKIIVYFLKLIVLMAINFGNCMNNSSFSTSSSSSSSSPLDHVVIVIRHGDRAPLISFPFDRTKMDELWPMGYGHLTAEGKRRMYRLGSFLRRRYHRRLPGKLLTPRDVYIRSSAIERCLESSELIAASLCPPQGVWIWNTNLGEQWQPLPIHSVPKYRDGLLNPASHCVRADKLSEQILFSSTVRKYWQEQKDFIQNVTNSLDQSLRNHREVRDLYDNLLILKHHGKRLPQWARNPTVYNRLKSIFHHSFRFDYTSMIEKDLKKLRTGMLLMEIFERLHPIATPKTNPETKKISIFVTVLLCFFLSVFNLR